MQQKTYIRHSRDGTENIYLITKTSFFGAAPKQPMIIDKQTAKNNFYVLFRLLLSYDLSTQIVILPDTIRVTN